MPLKERSNCGSDQRETPCADNATQKMLVSKRSKESLVSVIMRHDEREKLTESNGDYIRETISRRIKDSPWRFTNMLSIPLDVHEVSDTGKIGTKLFSMGPNEVKNMPHSSLRGHENICAMYRDRLRSEGSYLLLAPHKLHSHLKDISLGSVTYDEFGDTDYINVHADLPSVRIYNELPMAIDVYYTPREKYRHENPVKVGKKGNLWGTLVAQVNGRNLVDYRGGGNASVYFNNNYDGLRLGDNFTFAYKPTKTSEPIRLCTVEVKDNVMKNMYVGKIAAQGIKIGGGPDDIYAYSVDYEVSTGFPFYPAPEGSYATYNSQTRKVIQPRNAIQSDPLMFGGNPYDPRTVQFNL